MKYSPWLPKWKLLPLLLYWYAISFSHFLNSGGVSHFIFIYFLFVLFPIMFPPLHTAHFLITSFDLLDGYNQQRCFFLVSYLLLWTQNHYPELLSTTDVILSTENAKRKLRNHTFTFSFGLLALTDANNCMMNGNKFMVCLNLFASHLLQRANRKVKD